MSRVRGKRAQLALVAIPEDGPSAATGGGAVAEIMQLIGSLDSAVDEKINSIMSAAEDAIMQLKNECRSLLIRVPAKHRAMQLSEFQAAYPGDFQAGALEEIRVRCAAMAAAAAAVPVPATGRLTRTTAKRAAEPATVLRTVRARRGPVAPPPKFSEGPAASGAPPAGPLAAAAEADTASRRGTRSRVAVMEDASGEQQQQHAQPPTSRRSTTAAARPAGGGVFGGMPLQTPMPFAGEAVAMPITLLTQKRGGRSKAAPQPEAAVITTADGKQWALGAEGVSAIPDSHRQEVSDLLTAQFNFFAAALGKTVFQRDTTRGTRKR
ncbi:hypothetical protein D9Q98_000750 [Chlorella vulgaris]|uniref:Borealin N-terminal domain-containing protein n=1 Tax=Chlorella vulgaris TaxID=3077 RepID=A0A9D4TZW2_CHLVU|nr:hypothetical protein D9Q98_000750 [Chlorella vulgaris]